MKLKKNRLLSLWKEREVCISLQESLFTFYVYLLPPQWHTSNLYFDCFVFWGHLLPSMSISLLLPPRVHLFMTFWRINSALALAFHRSLKRIFTRASRCFPWWDLGNRLTDANMDASALRTELILRNEAASAHQYLSKWACQCPHREREMQQEGLLRHESHPSTSIASLHHPITMKFHNPALISKCVCVCV